MESSNIYSVCAAYCHHHASDDDVYNIIYRIVGSETDNAPMSEYYRLFGKTAAA